MRLDSASQNLAKPIMHDLGSPAQRELTRNQPLSCMIRVTPRIGRYPPQQPLSCMIWAASCHGSLAKKRPLSCMIRAAPWSRSYPEATAFYACFGQLYAAGPRPKAAPLSWCSGSHAQRVDLSRQQSYSCQQTYSYQYSTPGSPFPAADAPKAMITIGAILTACG